MPGQMRSIATCRATVWKALFKMEDDFKLRIEQALRDPKNMGELEAADAVGTAGSAACGDMVRLWIKFKQHDGKSVIDRATFQAFGCETAMAVASVATEILRGKTAAEALALSANDLAPELGPFPPIKVHCTQLVESALRAALQPASSSTTNVNFNTTTAPSLLDHFTPSNKRAGKLKIVLLDPTPKNNS